jgi:hypothetical protein
MGEWSCLQQQHPKNADVTESGADPITISKLQIDGTTVDARIFATVSTESKE